jgi:pilus assembly protein Flp/PilA
MENIMKISLNTLFARFIRNEEGATLVEYGIAIVLAVTVGTGALLTLATAIETNMDEATTTMAIAP